LYRPVGADIGIQIGLQLNINVMHKATEAMAVAV
jgi:hypothetical protein